VFNKDALAVLLEKVPDLKSPWRLLLTVIYILFLAIVCILFFYAVNRLSPYTPLLSQLVMALITILLCYFHFKLVPWFRRRYSTEAYRYYFYSLVLPYVVAWYACFFHPLFIDGPALLPKGLSIALGVLFLLLVPILSLHIERAGFHMETHGLDLYTVFPEETIIVRGEVYGYIRHPLYLALTCGAFGLGLIANNWIALAAAAMQLLPALYAAWMEDRELVERDGDGHRKYMGATGALLPRRDWPGFFRLLFLGLLSPESR
jgi:protein-S-isoprenylcysteine O-methyltransferase Ste14